MKVSFVRNSFRDRNRCGGAGSGAAPRAGFTGYAPFVGPNYERCRRGDYSMSAFSNGRILMGAEMIPRGTHDTLTNWCTFTYGAPPP